MDECDENQEHDRRKYQHGSGYDLEKLANILKEFKTRDGRCNNEVLELYFNKSKDKQNT